MTGCTENALDSVNPLTDFLLILWTLLVEIWTITDEWLIVRVLCIQEIDSAKCTVKLNQSKA